MFSNKLALFLWNSALCIYLYIYCMIHRKETEQRIIFYWLNSLLTNYFMGMQRERMKPFLNHFTFSETHFLLSIIAWEDDTTTCLWRQRKFRSWRCFERVHLIPLLSSFIFWWWSWSLNFTLSSYTTTHTSVRPLHCIVCNSYFQSYSVQPRQFLYFFGRNKQDLHRSTKRKSVSY